MGLVSTRAQAQTRSAPWRRRALAGSIDKLLVAGPVVPNLRRAVTHARAGEPSIGKLYPGARVLVPAWTVAREQLGSPGLRAMGLRIVDPRTGDRPQLWRSATRALVPQLTDALRTRMMPAAPPRPDEERRDREIAQIKERHADDAQARDRALMEYFERNRVATDYRRLALAALVPSLLAWQLRRRLGATVVVVAGDGAGRADHKP